MAWTGQSFSVGQILTAAQMSNLQSDITALANGDVGAPDIVEAALAAAVVAQLVTNGDSHDHSGGDGGAIPNASVTGLGALALLSSVAAAQIDAGAVGQSEIAANAVGQSELKTSTQADTLSSAATRRTMTGGKWTLFATGKGNGNSAPSYSQSYYATALIGSSYDGTTQQYDIDNSTTSAVSTRYYGYRTTTGVGAAASGTMDATFNFEYVSASPPYNLGDDDIPVFIFLEIDNTSGDVIGVSVAQDPPWAYNGKTDTRPDHYKKVNGVLVPYKNKPDIDICLSDCINSHDNAERYIDFLSDPKFIEYEITQEIKNRDRFDIPHNLTGADELYLKGKSIVLVDPVSKISERLLKMHLSGDSVGSLFMNGMLKIGNDKLKRCGSECNHIVDIRWANNAR